MNLVALSNAINQLAQLHPDIGFYHYGYKSDINRNINNNFTKETGGAKQMAALYLDFASERTAIEYDSPRTVADCYLVLTLPQGREGTGLGQINTNITIVQQHAELKRILLDILAGLEDLGRNQWPDSAGLENTTVTINYAANACGDGLVTAVCNFSFWYQDECPSIYTDLSQLPTDFQGTPPSTTEDFENV